MEVGVLKSGILQSCNLKEVVADGDDDLQVIAAGEGYALFTPLLYL